MTDTTLNQGAIHKSEWASASQWVKRLAAVMFCLGLFALLGVVFTRVIAARVPEQRATLEKLIAERTGLAVRFDDVRFAWNLEGASAVFTRVQLTDPAAGRVRVVAPELRVQLDTWDFLRHQRFSFGHVTLSSPDVDIIDDGDGSVLDSIAAAKRTAGGRRGASGTDEAALVRRYLSWAELMPVGRVEVEGARVHLKHRNEHTAHRSFTLSQAVVSRGGESFSAYGTMLLSQDVGQSLFVSAKLDGLHPAGRVSGELRFIARKIFLDRLSVPGLAGRGTLDARLKLRDGLVDSGSWQASARELRLNGDGGTRFDHVTLTGRLSREAGDLLMELNDLQLTRDAQLERAPALTARLVFDPHTLRIARARVQADHLPFMAAQLFAGLLAPRVPGLPEVPGDWSATAGEVRHGTLARQRTLDDVRRLVRDQLGDRTQRVAPDVQGQVEAVAGEVAEHPGAGVRRVEAPRQRLVGMRGVVGEHPYVDRLQRAERTVGHEPPRRLHRGCVAVVEADRRLHARVQHGRGDGRGVLRAAAGRLLDPQVPPRAGHGLADLAVHEVRAADAHHVDVVAVQERRPVVHGVAEAVDLHGRLPTAGVRVGHRREPGPQRSVGVVVGQARPRTRVHLTHPAEPHHRDTDLAGFGHGRVLSGVVSS